MNDYLIDNKDGRTNKEMMESVTLYDLKDNRIGDVLSFHRELNSVLEAIDHFKKRTEIDDSSIFQRT